MSQQSSSDAASLEFAERLLHMNGVTKYDPAVPSQLHTLINKLTTDFLAEAQQVAVHKAIAESKSENRERAAANATVGLEEVEEVAKVFLERFIPNDQQRLAEMREMVSARNAEPIPKPRSEHGLHLPNERFMCVQPDFEPVEERFRAEFNPVALHPKKEEADDILYSAAHRGPDYSVPGTGKPVASAAPHFAVPQNPAPRPQPPASVLHRPPPAPQAPAARIDDMPEMAAPSPSGDAVSALAAELQRPSSPPAPSRSQYAPADVIQSLRDGAEEDADYD